MIDTQWHRLVQDKLNLARCLVRHPESRDRLERTACLEGAVLLLNEARTHLLTHTARLCQVRNERPESLAGLRQLLGDEHVEVTRLSALLQTPGNWWSRLDAWHRALSEPRRDQPRTEQEGLIAVAVDDGLTPTESGVLELADAMNAYLDELSERHGEW